MRSISYFSKRWMNIKEKRAIDVITPHLPKVRLIPAAKENYL